MNSINNTLNDPPTIHIANDKSHYVSPSISSHATPTHTHKILDAAETVYIAGPS